VQGEQGFQGPLRWSLVNRELTIPYPRIYLDIENEEFLCAQEAERLKGSRGRSGVTAPAAPP